jgi:MFS family permease
MSDDSHSTGNTAKKSNFVVDYFKSFAVLKETRKEYWGMQVINFIDHTILFAVYTIAVLFFSTGSDKYGFGMADTTAGYVYTIFGGLTTMCLFFSGLVSDWLGIRRSMYVNQGCLLILRAAIVFITFNQFFVQGDLQVVVQDGQRLCVEDRTGAAGVPTVTGISGNGAQIIEQFGLTNLESIEFSADERAEMKINGSVYGGQVIDKPELKAVKSLRDVINRINHHPDNKLRGEKKKVEARLGDDKQSLEIVDHTQGTGTLTIANGPESSAASDLGLTVSSQNNTCISTVQFPIGSSTKLTDLHAGQGIAVSDFMTDLMITSADGTTLAITLGRDRIDIGRGTKLSKLNGGDGIHVVNPDPAQTITDLMARINHAEGNNGKIKASVEELSKNDHRLVITDTTEGAGVMVIASGSGTTAAADVGLAGPVDDGKMVGSVTLESPGLLWGLITTERGEDAALDVLGNGVAEVANGPELIITASDGSVISVEIGEMEPDVIRVATATGDTYDIDLSGVDSVGALMAGVDAQSGGWAWLLIAILFIAQAPFLAIGQTAFQSANKRFTTSKSRSAGFNLWYLFMNVGAALAGFLIDLVYIWMDLPRVHIFTVGVGTAVVCLFFIAVFVRREDQLRSPEEEAVAMPKVTEEDAAHGDAPKRLNPWQNFVAVATEPVFWRFTCLITLLIPVRAVFLYMHLLMPKFWERVIGPDAYIGLLTSLNPILVIVGLILLIPILNKFSVYKMLTYGAIVSGLSLFILAIPPLQNADWASDWPWLHDSLTVVSAFTYVMSVVCLTVLTVGEVIWSPRLTEYTAAIAPEGQEGTYLGFSMVPYFLAKTFVSAISGHMLLHWCAPPSEENPLQLHDSIEMSLETGDFIYWSSPWAMWFVLAVPAVGGPLLALLLKGWFTKGAHFKHGDHTE